MPNHIIHPCPLMKHLVSTIMSKHKKLQQEFILASKEVVNPSLRQALDHNGYEMQAQKSTAKQYLLPLLQLCL